MIRCEVPLLLGVSGMSVSRITRSITASVKKASPCGSRAVSFRWFLPLSAPKRDLPRSLPADAPNHATNHATNHQTTSG